MTLSPGVHIRIESPRPDDVARMLAALDAYLEALHPPESNHVLNVAALSLYRSAGYRERAPFGESREDPLSLFMEMVLATT